MEFKMLEYKKKATDKFNEIDGNGSGFLANDELDKLVTFVNGVCFDFFEARKVLLEKYDKDHDGKINLDEFLCIMDDIAHSNPEVVQTSIGPRLIGCWLFVLHTPLLFSIHTPTTIHAPSHHAILPSSSSSSFPITATMPLFAKSKPTESPPTLLLPPRREGVWRSSLKPLTR